MIGGIDIVYPSRLSAEMLGCMYQHIRNIWPSSVFQAADAEAAPVPMTEAPFSVGDFFVYKNMATWESWVQDGQTPANDDLMLYVLQRESKTTFVVAEAPGTTRQMVAGIILGFDRRGFQ